MNYMALMARDMESKILNKRERQEHNHFTIIIKSMIMPLLLADFCNPPPFSPSPPQLLFAKALKERSGERYSHAAWVSGRWGYKRSERKRRKAGRRDSRPLVRSPFRVDCRAGPNRTQPTFSKRTKKERTCKLFGGIS